MGPRPFLLRLLARIYIAKGDLPTARTFLSQLSKDIAHGQWAKQQLAEIADPQAIDDDADIMAIRSVMLSSDNLDPRTPQATLEALVQQKPRQPHGL